MPHFTKGCREQGRMRVRHHGRPNDCSLTEHKGLPPQMVFHPLMTAPRRPSRHNSAPDGGPRALSTRGFRDRFERPASAVRL